MNTRTAFSVLLALCVLFAGCKKDELDVAELTTNPFDADYTGEPVFTTTGVHTEAILVGGDLVRNLHVDVRVNTALFPEQGPYDVQYGLPSGVTVQVPSSELADNAFRMTATNVTVGVQYCFEPRLANNGAVGSRTTLCGTAE
jgi:hypothetical protein